MGKLVAVKVASATHDNIGILVFAFRLYELSYQTVVAMHSKSEAATCRETELLPPRGIDQH